jgi:aspartate kinase
MQSRSVEFAKKFGVIFEVRSSLNDNPGTIVKESSADMENVVVRGVSLDKNQAKVTLENVPDHPGIAASIFKPLSEASVNVDMIVQNVSHEGGQRSTDLSFTLERTDLTKALKVLAAHKEAIGYQQITSDENICKLSVVGVGMRSHSGVAARLFEVLHEASVNILMISTSEIKISVVIESSKGEQALREAHQAFVGS